MAVLDFDDDAMVVAKSCDMAIEAEDNGGK